MQTLCFVQESLGRKHHYKYYRYAMKNFIRVLLCCNKKRQDKDSKNYGKKKKFM